MIRSAPAAVTESVGAFVQRHRPVQLRRAEIRPLLAAQPTRIMIIADSPIELGDVLERFPAAEILLVMIAGKGPKPILRLFSGRVGLPERFSVQLVPEAPEITALLRDLPPQQAIIDAAIRTRIKKYALRRFPYFLAEGGSYLITGLDDGKVRQRRRGASTASRLSTHQVSATLAAETVLSRYLEITEVTAGSVMITKRGRHVIKLYDREVVPALEARVGPGWGAELTHRPGFTFTARSRLAVNDPEYGYRFPTRWPVPDRYLRLHHDVVCGPRQLVLQDGAVLPWSFHHPQAERRHARGTQYISNLIAALPDGFRPARELPGSYFHLDSEFPGQYGHFLTEDLSRLWGWRLAKERYPDCKLLLSRGRRAAGLKPFQRTLLGAFGVADDDLEVISEPVRVERLLGATPQFHNRRYIDPDLSRVWDQVRAVLRLEARIERAQRIFVARPAGSPRRCRNAAEVEQIFAEHGFKVVRPETLSVPDQVGLFATAHVIAGYSGAGMFNMIYSDRPGTRIVLGSEQSNAINEYLIAAVKGDDYHHFCCPPASTPAAEEKSTDSATGDYVFDTARDGGSLRRLLAGL